MSSYAIISLGGKQYRVREGERLLVDHLRGADEGATVEPRVLLVAGDGAPDLAPSVTVTARIVGHELGEKIRIGKYRKRTGYKKHTGHRSRLTRIEIESIGAKRAKAAAKPKAEKVDEKAGAEADVARMTIAQLTEAAAGWSKTEVEAALEQERSGKARKGALAALESALEEKQ